MYKRQDYICFLNKLIEKDKFDISDFDDNIENEEYQEKAQKFIKAQISNYKINSIGNLVC